MPGLRCSQGRFRDDRGLARRRNNQRALRRMKLPFGAMRNAYCTLQQPDIHTSTVRNWHTTDRRYIKSTVGCIAAVEVLHSNLDLHKTASFRDLCLRFFGCRFFHRNRLFRCRFFSSGCFLGGRGFFCDRFFLNSRFLFCHSLLFYRPFCHSRGQ